MKKQLIVFFCIAQLLCVFVYSQKTDNSNRSDGNWWIGEDEAIKLGYTLGFFDGMELGGRFSYWKFVGDKNKEACFRSVTDSFEEYEGKYLSNITVRQVVDGLDTFYADYKNRRIQAWDAVWLVLNGIAGTSKEELDAMIESFRRHSAP